MKKTSDVLIRGIFPDTMKAMDVVLRNGVVQRVSRAGKSPADFGSSESFVGPTLTDIQVNGVAGIDLQGSEVQVQDVARIAHCLAQNGVSCWIPTLVSGAQKDIAHGCRVLSEAMQNRQVAHSAPGIHIEGPFISPLDGPRGAHPKAHVRPPSLKEFDHWQKAAQGKIRYVTLAPETPGAGAFIRGLSKRGVLVSLGHHAASEEAITKAVDAGARLCTHLGNGAASQIHRHQNPLWPQLAEDRLTASLIADMHHLPESVLRCFVRAKGPERVVLVSDCVHLTGLKAGRYHFAGAEVDKLASGKICLAGTDLLAGSGLLLIEGVINAWRHTDMSLEQAFASASTIPAQLLGLRRPAGLPKVGRKADFICFDLVETKKQFKPKLQRVFIQGKDISCTE